MEKGKEEAEQCQKVKEAAEAVKEGAQAVKETTEYIHDVASTTANRVINQFTYLMIWLFCLIIYIPIINLMITAFMVCWSGHLGEQDDKGCDRESYWDNGYYHWES